MCTSLKWRTVPSRECSSLRTYRPEQSSKEVLATVVYHVKENSRRRCPALFYLTFVYLSINHTKSPWPCVFNLHTELRTVLHRNDLLSGDAGLMPPHQDLALTMLVQGAGLYRLWWRLDIVHCPWCLISEHTDETLSTPKGKQTFVLIENTHPSYLHP